MNQIFSALSDPTRLNIVETLAARGQLSASEIYNHFEVSHPAISQHLRILREANLVSVEKQAQQRLYRINLDKIAELERWTAEMRKVWNPRFARLDNLLKNKKEVTHG